MSHAITINISDTLYQQLRQAASLLHRPTETIIVESLGHILPPLFEEIPVDYQDEVFPLLAMTDRELLREAQQTFPQERWQAYESLLERKKAEALRPGEEQAFQELRHEADSLSFRRSYAAVLLKRRGYHVQPPQREPQVA